MSTIDRRGFVSSALAAGLVAGARSVEARPPAGGGGARSGVRVPMRVERLGFPWRTPDPFLFCAYHLDHYPKGDERMGPATSLAGRRLGRDFSRRDGWSMYHGRVIPGFPRHPHRGFETITLARQGLVDHADSLGATARYGDGDVQWMTAGRGIVHAEMFPLRRRDRDNPLDLFQLWLNLPKRSKMVAPYFRMMWRHTIPTHRLDGVTITTVAGALSDRATPAPPPDSWAAHADAHVAIWTITLAPGARWTLPAVPAGVNRSLYFHRGDMISVADRVVAVDHRVELLSPDPIPLTGGSMPAHILLLQGHPIGEPVAKHGPFVMNTESEIRQAYADHRADGFGGWPWPSDAPVHGRDRGRFAIHADGRQDIPG